jgi:hypothetical protein
MGPSPAAMPPAAKLAIAPAERADNANFGLFSTNIAVLFKPNFLSNSLS